MLKMPENATHRPMWLAYVNVQDVDATTAHAKELGGKVALAPADIPDIGRFAVLIDPTDATIAIHKPKA